MNRRTFLQTASTAAVASLFPVGKTSGAEGHAANRWPIGCLNRPWVSEKKSWSVDVALDGIRDAGYRLAGLLTRTAHEPFIGSDATPGYLAALQEKITARGLTVNLGALRLKEETPVEEQIQDARRQIDNGQKLGLKFLLTFGVANAEHFGAYCRLMRETSAYAGERGIQVVLKPHGGASGAAPEILACLAMVKHSNFKVWFDPGNIIYYTGLDPVEQLKSLAEHVTGVCAKDCDKQQGTPWVQFGQGRVDFRGVFAELKRGVFAGPVMVECCAQGDTAESVTANARRNREYLEALFASL